MTHFRFRYKRVGLFRWRGRAGRRRACPLVMTLETTPCIANVAVWRRKQPPGAAAPTPASAELRVGDYVVGENGDPLLQGHPDIRY